MGLGNLIFRLFLDKSPFDRALATVPNQLQKAAASAGGHVERFFNSRGRAIAAAAASYFSYATVRSITNLAGELVDMEQSTGVNIEKLQEFDFALRRNGSTVKESEQVFKALAEARQAALQNPNGQQGRAFDVIGIKGDELKNITDIGVLFEKVGESVKRLGVNANSLPVFVDLLGRKAMQVLPAMNEGLKDLGEQARDSGTVMKAFMADALDEAGDRVDELARRFQVGLAPVVLMIVEMLERIPLTLINLSAGFNTMMYGILSNLPFKTQNMKDMAEGFKQLAEEDVVKLAKEQRRVADLQDPAERVRRAQEKRDRAAQVKGLTPPEEMTRTEFKRERSDSLVAVGNFLGGDPTSSIKNQVKQIQGLLTKIERHAKKTAEGGIVIRK